MPLSNQTPYLVTKSWQHPIIITERNCLSSVTINDSFKWVCSSRKFVRVDVWKCRKLLILRPFWGTRNQYRAGHTMNDWRLLDEKVCFLPLFKDKRFGSFPNIGISLSEWDQGLEFVVRKDVIPLPGKTKGFHNLTCLLSSLQTIRHTFAPGWNLSETEAGKEYVLLGLSVFVCLLRSMFQPYQIKY